MHGPVSVVGGAMASVQQHDVEEIIGIGNRDWSRRAQEQLVFAEFEGEWDIRWNHGTMSRGAVGVDGSRADRLVIKRYLDSDRLVRGLRPHRAGDYQTARTIGRRFGRYGNRKRTLVLIQDHLDSHWKSSRPWRVKDSVG